MTVLIASTDVCVFLCAGFPICDTGFVIVQDKGQRFKLSLDSLQELNNTTEAEAIAGLTRKRMETNELEHVQECQSIAQGLHSRMIWENRNVE